MENLNTYLKHEVFGDNQYSFPKLISCFFLCGPQRRSILLYRLGKYFYDKKKNWISKYFFNKLQKNYGVYISNKASISLGLQLPHPVGIVIGEGVSIGQNAIIYQNTTIGGARRGDWEANNYPKIGNNVVIFASSTIIGKIEIQDNCIIGANSVVTKNTPKNSVIAGVPAKILRNK